MTVKAQELRLCPTCKGKGWLPNPKREAGRMHTQSACHRCHGTGREKT